MIRIYFVWGIVLGLMPIVACSQTEVPGFIPVMPLPEELKECSGLIDLGDNIFVGLNDSGNKPELFRFSADPKSMVRSYDIQAASNQDWEELASDDYFLYIGDMGNNSGQRKNLVIYKVPRQDLFSGQSLTIEKIHFSYGDQKKFKASNDHNFDCEAMISLGDSLYLFTKNRGNGQTNVYPCPKTPGTYVLHKTDSFDAEGLVTGAAYYAEGKNSQLALIGYSFEAQGYHPFIIHFTGFTGNHFFSGSPKKITFDGNLQTETILFADRNSVMISNEAEHNDAGYLYRVYLQNP